MAASEVQAGLRAGAFELVRIEKRGQGVLDSLPRSEDEDVVAGMEADGGSQLVVVAFHAQRHGRVGRVAAGLSGGGRLGVPREVRHCRKGEAHSRPLAGGAVGS